MEFRFSESDQRWRQEVRGFLQENRSGIADVRSDAWARSRENWDATTGFVKKLAEKGWLTLHWPVEYGGQGRSHVEQMIFREELANAGADIGRAAQGLNNLGPTLMVHGTDEQKKEFLPPIARGDVIWCQGFSEPGAGSDLASLQTRAVLDGDDFVVSGQKIWTSGAHVADWCYLLVRTDTDAPKHRGISMLLVDMKSPGITIQPLLTMENAAHFCQVFYDNVRVPRSRLVGEQNRGWYVATTTLDFERSGIGYAAGALRTIEGLVRFAAATAYKGGRLIDRPGVRLGLANATVEANVGRMLSYRVISMQARGVIPNYEASMVKLFGTELGQRVARLGMEIAGMHGQLEYGSAHAPMNGRLASRYLGSVSGTVAAGTSEVQRNIIATRGLGLPRG